MTCKRETTPFAVRLNDDGLTHKAQTRAEAIDEAVEYLQLQFDLGEPVDGDDYEIEIYTDAVWLIRPDDITDPEWQDLAMEGTDWGDEWSYVMVSRGGVERVTLKCVVNWVEVVS